MWQALIKVATSLAELVGRVAGASMDGSTKAAKNTHMTRRLFDGRIFDAGRSWAAQRYSRLFQKLGVPPHPHMLQLASARGVPSMSD